MWVHERQFLPNQPDQYDQVIRLVDEARAVDVVYLHFSRAFDAVSHCFLLEKLAS